MSKYLLPAAFVLFSALSVAVYAYIAFELKDSTITTKRSISVQPDVERR